MQDVRSRLRRGTRCWGRLYVLSRGRSLHSGRLLCGCYCASEAEDRAQQQAPDTLPELPFVAPPILFHRMLRSLALELLYAFLGSFENFHFIIVRFVCRDCPVSRGSPRSRSTEVALELLHKNRPPFRLRLVRAIASRALHRPKITGQTPLL